MSFNFGLFLDLARELGGRAADDAAKRTAVSRAYYCAFHAADASLRANNVLTNPKYERNTHKKVWNIYISSARRDVISIGIKGFRLKNERVAADYYPNEVFDVRRVQHSIRDAESLVRDIPAHVPENFPGVSRSPMRRVALWFGGFVRCVKNLFGR